MIIIRGALEMLQMANNHGPKSFNDFTKIEVKGKSLSSATVSKRLDELIAVNAIEEVITRSKTGRRVIAYRTTKKGTKIIGLAKELREALAVSDNKQDRNNGLVS
jgi:DNA-binding HxlR family transcriptional regulator